MAMSLQVHLGLGGKHDTTKKRSMQRFFRPLFQHLSCNFHIPPLDLQRDGCAALEWISAHIGIKNFCCTRAINSRRHSRNKLEWVYFSSQVKVTNCCQSCFSEEEWRQQFWDVRGNRENVPPKARYRVLSCFGQRSRLWRALL